jgi:hypothetical protein
MLTLNLLNLKRTLKSSLPILALTLGAAHANALAQPISLTIPLTVSQEVGPIDPSTPKTSQGQGNFVYDPSSHILSYNIRYSDLSGAPTMAHFHLGARHNAGPVIQMICGAGMSMACPSGNSGQVQGNWKVPDADIQALLSGNVFVNFHTKLNAAGEIRGQLSAE